MQSSARDADGPSGERGISLFVVDGFRAFPLLYTITILLTIAGLFSEGLGIGLFVPLLGHLAGSSPGQDNAFVNSVRSLLATLSISDSLGGILLLIVVLFFLKAVLTIASGFLGSYMGALWRNRWHERIYDALLDAEYSFFLTRRSGTVSSRLLREVDASAAGIGAGVQLLSEIVTVLLYLGVGMMLRPDVTAATIGVGLVAFLAFRSVIVWGRRLGDMGRSAMESFACFLEESLANIRLLKAMDAGDAFRQKIRHESRTFRWVQIRIAVHTALLTKIHEPILVLFICAVMFVGAKMFSVDIAVFLVLLSVLYRSYARLSSIPTTMYTLNVTLPSHLSLIRGYQEARAASEGKSGLLDAPPFESMRVERLAFAYDRETVLHRIDLEIRRGETVGLVGASGSGKTTLITVLMGLIHDYQGRIVLNGDIPLEKLDLAAWRRRLGYVSQESQLFYGTVAENVTVFGDRSEAEIREALDRADAWEFVSKLPRREHTIIGERGVQLSGGQRQRLALARALVRKPELLFLDEPTSELDSESEERIRRSVAELSGSVTVVMAAHRLATVRDADRIIVLTEGRVEEEGTFEKLAAAGGTFQRLVRRQSLPAGRADPAAGE